MVSDHTCPRWSNGILPRILNALSVRYLKANVLHVTGDIHYVNILTPKRHNILTIHDVNFLSHAKGLKRALLKLFWITIPINRSAMVTTVSSETANRLIELAPKVRSKLRVIPDPANPNFHFVSANFNAQNPRILCVGTAANKNLERLIEACSMLSVEPVLDIVGPLTDSQIQLLDEHKINYLNSAGISNDEMVEHYQKCDMLAFVSTAEGFGLPILEAQITGRPVVTSNISSMPEVAGDGAFLVDPLSPKSIADGLLKVIQDEEFRSRLIDRGRSNAKRFDIEVIASMYLDLYKELGLLN